MSVIHFHQSIKPDAGDTRRVRNIDKSVCDRLSSKKIEVLIYGWSRREEFKKIPPFTLTENVKKKYCFSMLYRIKWFSELTSGLQLAYVCKKHNARYIVSEFGSSARSLKLLHFLCPKVKIVIDFHGAQPEEMIYENPNIAKSLYDYYESLERKSCEISDCIICQSDEMKQHLVTKYNADGNKIAVFKCGVNTKHFDIKTNEERSAVRKELGINENDVVFVYAGGMAVWQKIETSLGVFKEYNAHNPNSKFLILTRANDRLNAILENKEWDTIKSSIIATSAPYAKVPSYLNAADIAYLIRDNVILNAVASPTKLAEYLACGLPVITSSVAKKWVKEEMKKNFVFTDEATDVNYEIDKVLRNCKSNEIRQYAIDYLSVEKDEKNIDAILNKTFKI